MNPHRLLNEVGANYSAYRTRNFVGVLTRHLIHVEHNKYASWTLLLGLWAPGGTYLQRTLQEVTSQDSVVIMFIVMISYSQSQ